MSFLDSAIQSIGQGLARTAADQIQQSTGVNVGGTLGFLFGNGQTTGGSDMSALSDAINQKFADQKAMLTELQASMYQQQQQLNAIGVQLTGIANALTRITGMIQNIQAMLQAIQQQQLFLSWQAVDNEMVNYIGAIDSSYTTYGNYIANYKTTPTNEVTLLIQNILDTNVGPVVGLRNIFNYLMGSGGQSKGALQLWSEMVMPLVLNGTLDYRLAVQQYFQYYQRLTYAQLKATNLVMEAYVYNSDKTNATLTWNQYNSQLKAQEDTFITWLAPLVYAGVTGGIIPQAAPNPGYQGVNFTAVDASMQLNPAVQYVQGDATNPGNAFYTPSAIFEAAEQLLANLYVTRASDRRIVVHMLYPNLPAITALLDGLSLTLSPTGTVTQINSVSSSRMGSPYNFPTIYNPLLPDQNVYTGNGFYLKRFVFSDSAGLVDGTYNVTNLNGKQGLLPIQTYVTWEEGKPASPFQMNNIVSYVMQVTSASKFDFMNFAAYTQPLLTA